MHHGIASCIPYLGRQFIISVFFTMAQGKLKTKSCGIAKKAKTHKKILGPKKGGRSIAPKKSKPTNVKNVRKKLEVQIKRSIETDALNKAGRTESKSLNILKTEDDKQEQSQSQKKKTQKKNKKRK